MSLLFKHLVAILNTKHRRFYIGGLALILCAVSPNKAMSVDLPSVNGLQFQTSGPKRCATIGDWYTTDGSGANCTATTTTSTDKKHRFNVGITQEMINAAGGTVNITILDAESTAGGGDEVQGTSDPTRFQLYNSAGTLLNSRIVLSGSPDGTNIVFSVNSPGTYQVTSETGARFISGDSSTTLNDDDNTFRIRVPDAGASPELQGLIGQFQGTMQQNTASDLSFKTYFLVGPGTNALKLRNFDLDGKASLVYRNPSNNVRGTATVSGDAAWNGSGGNLNTGSDNLLINTASPNFSDVGVWTIEVNDLTPNNQFILEANTGQDKRLGLYDVRPARAGNFAITPNTTRTTTVNTPVDHPFSVSNNFATTDIINLSLSKTNPNYTVRLINANTGQPLTDSDNDGKLDTGILNSNQTIDLILRVTPNTGSTNRDTTQINAVSYMSNKIDPNRNITRSITKTTILLDYGDAPVSYDDTADNNPARHEIASNLYLGSIAPDAEAAPQNSPNADGDDNATSPNVDDEDAFTNLPNVNATATATGNYSLNVPITNTSGGNAKLHGWIDFNKNGKFESGEYQSADVTNTSPVNLTWAVPAGTTPGNTHARFRLTSDTLTDNGSTNNIDERSIGNANNGEVEDYKVAIAPAPLYDYGDAPDTGPGTGMGNYKTTAADGGAAQVVIDTAGQVLSIGNNIDFDDGSLQSSNADEDDIKGSVPDDEDGVSSFPTLTTAEGQTYTVTVTARNNVPAVPAYLVGFIDFNKDGDFEDDGEQSNTVEIASDALGNNGELRTFKVTFTTPAGMTPGDTYARFRLGQIEATARSATGASAGTDNGEIEDYKIAIASNNNPNISTNFCQASASSHNLLFILDDSSSVDSTELQQQRDAVMATLNDFIAKNLTGQAAIVGFDSVGRTVINYTNITTANLSTFQTALNTQYGVPGSGTNWEAGFRQGITLGVDKPDIVFFFTDGASNRVGSPDDEATQFKNAGAHIYGIGVQGLTVESGFRGITDGIDTIVYDGSNPLEADFLQITQYSTLQNQYTNAFLKNLCPADFGDAPDTYGTDNIANNSNNTSEPLGANHAKSSGLYLGATAPDTDANGFVDGIDNNNNATDDDAPIGTGTGNGDDEDNFTLPTLTEGDTSYTIPADNITVTNTIGKTATLHAWIDFNNSGIFETGEHASVAVNNNTNNGNPTANLTWSGINVGAAGNTYARFRLTTDSSINNATPGGNASDGEVEDYQIAIATASDPNLLLVKRITAINPGQSDEIKFNSFVNDDSNNDNDPNWPEDDNTYLRGAVNIEPEVAVVEPGDEVEYTIYFLSNGKEDATNVKICDLIPNNMTFVSNSIALLNSSASGATARELSNAADADEGTFIAPGIAPVDPEAALPLCGKPDPNDPDKFVPVDATDNVDGIVVVELDFLPEATAPGTPANSYGFIRFRARVK